MAERKKAAGRAPKPSKRKKEAKPPPATPGPTPSTNGHYASPTNPILTKNFARCMSGEEVKEAKLEWMAESYIPRSLITLVTGDTGTGKSTFLSYLAACVSRGLDPFSRKEVTPGNVLIYSPEEQLGWTVKPRLEAANADMSRIYFGDYAIDGSLLPRLRLPFDARRLKVHIICHHATLLILDPITAYIGDGLEAKDDLGVRRLLDEIQLIGVETGCAILLTRHNRKSREGSILDRVGGNGAWTHFPRSVVACAHDPNDEDKRIFAVTKPSMGKRPRPVRYTIQSSGEVGIFVLGEVCSMSNDELNDPASTAADRDALADACALLLDTLAEGEVAAKEVLRMAQDTGITLATLRRAKSKLKIKSHPVGNNQSRYHVWTLPLNLPSA